MASLADGLSDEEFNSLCSYLDEVLESYDAKAVFLKIDIISFSSRNWSDAEEWFWLDRSVSSPYSIITENEVEWVKKYLGQSEGDSVAKEFGDNNEIHCLIYVEDTPNSNDKPTKYTYLAAVSKSEDD